VCFFVQGRRPLCYLHDDHNGDGRLSLWCPSVPEVQEELVSAEPRRFFRPRPSASGTFSLRRRYPVLFRQQSRGLE